MRQRVFNTLALLLVLLVSAPVWADEGNQGTINSTNRQVLVSGLSDRGSGVVRISSMCTCTLIVEGTVRNSTTFATIANAPDLSGGDGDYAFTAAGYSNIRVRASAFTSGSTTVSISISDTGGGTSSGGGGGSGDFTISAHNAAFGTAGTPDGQVRSIQGISGGTEVGTVEAAGALLTAAQAALTSTNFAAAFGTAGSADTQVMSIQGIASMTPILATVTATNLDVQIGGSDTVTVTATNLSTNVAQINGVTVLMGAGNTGTGSIRVTEATDSTLNAKFGTAAAGADNVANPTLGGIFAFQMCYDGSTWDRCTGAGADTELPSAAALADNTANPTVPGVAAFLMCWDSATWDRCPTATGGAGAVDANTNRVTLASDDPAVVSLAILDDWDESDRAKVNLIVGQAGIAAGSGTIGATVPRVNIATDDPVNDALVKLDAAVAVHGSAFGANVVMGGLAYRADLSGTAAEADGDSLRALGDGFGRALGGLVCQSGNIIDGQADITDGSSTSVVAAAGANIVTEIWEVDIQNTSATQMYVDFRDGTAGAVLRRFPVPAASGISRSLKVPIRTTANTALAADPQSTGSTISVGVGGCSTR